ncbi:DUF4738 domain-containing protein [Prevotella intermedia]|uniref:DUF4738 domain-containing protein n=1 Tax=Prevotella intermedia TaxID=28131 RepID=A0A2G8ID83_PREIN|nr:DUF4738 domain-containing protein [Prevotella intermedia]PIK21409.1 DUF4738 domain-containing protein [Prevotella intermedia]
MKAIRNISLILLCGLLTLAVTSCKKEKKTDNIITKIKPQAEPSDKPQQLSDFEYKKQVEWLGNLYTITIQRHADKDLPMITDSDGKKYYDNKVEVLITRTDGTEFFKRTFKKSDFKEFTDNKYGRNGAFIGFMFDKVEGNYLKFGASVGSPDPNSDEFIPIDIAISNLGALKITSSAQIDTESDAAESTLQEKPKTELEMAEEEGM